MAVASHPINLNKTQKYKLLEACRDSTRTFAQVFFPDRFFRNFSPNIHDRIFDLLDDPSKQRVAIAAPRGHGKTSIFNLAYPAKRILFEQARNILLISDSQDHALKQSETLKRQLLSNPTINYFFGSVKPGNDVAFSKQQWITNTGISIQPLGAGQQLRGNLHDGARPDLVIVDDLEDKDGVRNPDRRELLKEFLLEDVLGMFDLSDKNWKLAVIGTVLHEDSLLNNLISDEYDDWHSMRLQMCDDEYNSNWPEYVTSDQCKAMADSFSRKGKLDSFYREYRNLPIATENATFRQDMFRHFDEKDLDLTGLESVVLIDPAKTTGSRSAFTAIMGVSIDLSKNAIYVRHAIAERMPIGDMIEKAIFVAKRIGARTVGIEVTGLNEFATHPFREELSRRREYLELVELKARGHKEDRVAALAYYYNNNLIHHLNGECRALEDQLMMYPRSKYWDLMDALAYIVEMKEHGNRFMLPEGEEDPEMIENEYKELTDGEDKYSGKWRMAV